MKHFVLAFIISLLFQFSFSQNNYDKLILKDKSELKGNVKKVGKEYIYIEKDGIIDSTARDDVNLIIYKDNTVIKMNETNVEQIELEKLNKLKHGLKKEHSFVYANGFILDTPWESWEGVMVHNWDNIPNPKHEYLILDQVKPIRELLLKYMDSKDPEISGIAFWNYIKYGLYQDLSEIKHFKSNYLDYGQKDLINILLNDRQLRYSNLYFSLSYNKSYSEFKKELKEKLIFDNVRMKYNSYNLDYEYFFFKGKSFLDANNDTIVVEPILNIRNVKHNHSEVELDAEITLKFIYKGNIISGNSYFIKIANMKKTNGRAFISEELRNGKNIIENSYNDVKIGDFIGDISYVLNITNNLNKRDKEFIINYFSLDIRLKEQDSWSYLGN
ncbi:MAG: hypothetical protein V2I54_03610 [Bacteroidales bacterium]|jgi:hypothetical protein|nr:hypothetical protein [Bacteroidales bacterium]